MTLHFTIEPYDTLVVHLRDGDQEATVSVHPSQAGMQSMLRALDAAIADGYGECFWPGSPGGQHWWIFKRTSETLEVCAMWTRGGASLWEHVFRATDSADWVGVRLREEIARLEAAT